MANEIITQDGEIAPATEDRSRDVDMGAMVSLARAEIDIQIATARRYARSLTKVISTVTMLATIDEETAEECCYALLRKKKGKNASDEEDKPIEGPSIRLAEIAAQCYGNCRIDARVISVNRQEKYVEAEGIFHDLETNMASRATVRRRISTKGGYLFSDDMIVVTGNAACAIAKRNAILSGIPRSIIRPAYKAARGVIAGTVQTIGENRSKVYKAFASYGVTPAQIHDLIGVVGEADVTLDHIALLRATFSSIKNNEVTIAEVFPKERGNEGVADPLGSGKSEPKKAPAPDDIKKADPKPDKEKQEVPASGQVTGEKSPSESNSAANAGAVSDKAGDAASSASPAKESVEATPKTESAGERTSEPSATTQKPDTGGAHTAAASPVKDKSEIKTGAEYVAYIEDYLAKETSASAVAELWNGDRAFRMKLLVPEDWNDVIMPALKKKVTARKEELAKVVEDQG